MKLIEGINFDKVAKRVFQILKGHGFSLKMYKENGDVALDPEKEARKFIVIDEGLTVSINRTGEYSELKVLIAEKSDYKKLESILLSLKNIATYFGLNYNIRKFAEKLTPKNFGHEAYIEREREKEEMAESNVQEAKDIGKLKGTSKSSYQKIGKPAKMIVRHSKPVEEKFAGRSRNISKIFVETPEGERIKFPVNWLQGARAMTRHISEGGVFNDDIGIHIRNVSEEFKDLKSFTRHAGRNLEESASDIVSMVRERADVIARQMKSIQGPRSYRRFSESFKTEENMINEESLVEEINRIKEMFAFEGLDDVIETVARATSTSNWVRQEDIKKPEQAILNKFESWTNDFDVHVLHEGDYEFGFKDSNRQRRYERDVFKSPDLERSPNLSKNQTRLIKLIKENNGKYVLRTEKDVIGARALRNIGLADIGWQGQKEDKEHFVYLTNEGKNLLGEQLNELAPIVGALAKGAGAAARATFAKKASDAISSNDDDDEMEEGCGKKHKKMKEEDDFVEDTEISRMKELAGISEIDLGPTGGSSITDPSYEKEPDYEQEVEIEDHSMDRIHDYFTNDEGRTYLDQLKSGDYSYDDKEALFSEMIREVMVDINKFIENEYQVMDWFGHKDIKRMTQKIFDKMDIEFDLEDFTGGQLRRELHADPITKQKFEKDPTTIIKKYEKKI